MLNELENADVIIITAGAGIGVDSGLPDFRGNEGFWKAYPPLKEAGISFESIANPNQFEINPSLAWAFYGHRFDLYKNTIPHNGFKMLFDFIQNKEDYFIVTSNVDGQFQKAGFDQNKIYEIHGRINTFQGMHCDCLFKADEDLVFNVNAETLEIESNLPTCQCGEIARPNIMMFGDFNYDSTLSRIQEVLFDKFLKKSIDENKKIAIIEIGAGTAIPSIRWIGEKILKDIKNTILIRINPREFDGPNGIIPIPLGGLEGLNSILN